MSNDGRGWFLESKRHALASKGVKTGRKITDTKSFARYLTEKAKGLWEKEKKAFPKQKAWVKKETDIVAEKLVEGAKKGYEYEKEHLPEQAQFLKEIVTIPPKEQTETDGRETFSEWLSKKGRAKGIDDPTEEEEEHIQYLKEQRELQLEQIRQQQKEEERKKFAPEFEKGLLEY